MSENLKIPGPVVVAQSVDLGLARRRLIRAGLAAAPVVLALSGRSAMATGGCGAKGLSPMAWNSIAPGANGNCVILSHNVGRNILGRSPGFWMPNTGPSANVFQGPWPAPTIIPFSTYVAGSSYVGIGPADARWATGTKFNIIFPATFSGLFSGVIGTAASSISRLLIDNPAAPIAIKLACAYLNALTFTGYAMTVAEVLFLAANKKLVAGGPILSDDTIRDFLDQTWS